MTPDAVALVDALVAARRTHQALAPWPTLVAPEEPVAFAIQHACGVALGEWAADDLPRHWKCGGASRTARLSHSPLLPSGVRQGDAGRPADLRDLRWFSPGVEAEIALRLARPVTADEALGLRAEDAAGLVDALAVAIEVVDSRWRDDPALAPTLKTADMQVHGAFVHGPWQPWAAGRHWAAQRGTLQRDDDAPVAFAGSHPLGDPAWLLPAWLRHLSRNGATVPAGTVVTTGTWTLPCALRRGQRVCVRFEGLGSAALLA